MKDLQAIARACESKLSALNIPFAQGIVYTVNTRAKQRWGQCKLNPYNHSYSININSVLLADTTSLQACENTVLHEIIHTIKGCMNHGSSWQYYANKVNRAYGYDIKRCTSAEEKGLADNPIYTANKQEAYKYVLRCNSCKHEFKRMRMSDFVKHPQLYKCNCGGSIKRIV